MSGGRPRVTASHGVMSIRSSPGASFAMIDLHYAPTPNGWKISILLEELGLPYTVTPVNIRAGEQFKPEFLAISPNNRIPAIVDHAPLDGGGPLSVFETGAILVYLAQKTNRFLPTDLRGFTQTMQSVSYTHLTLPTKRIV